MQRIDHCAPKRHDGAFRPSDRIAYHLAELFAAFEDALEVVARSDDLDVMAEIAFRVRRPDRKLGFE